MNYAVILAGGRGIRFWPLSRQDEPKQLLKIFGRYSLLQHTCKRISKVIDTSRIYVVTNDDYAAQTKHQLKELDFKLENIIVEVSAKNTAASIGLVAEKIAKIDKDAVLAVFPADHFIKKEPKFLLALKRSLRIAQSDRLVIFGIKPLRAESAYGYVKVDQKQRISALGGYKVLKFIEKPARPEADRLIKAGAVYWNGGILVGKVSMLLGLTRKFMPLLFAVLKEKRESLFVKKWNSLKPVSMDYGILERCKNELCLMPLDCGWTDLGNWSTIDFVLERDRYGNALHGDAMVLDTHDTTVWSGHHLVVGIGLKDMVIADTPDALLVASKEHVQKVADVVGILKKKRRFEYTSSRLVHRPWGKYFVLNEAGSFKTKVVEVEPHKRLSLQLHRMRAEHWVIVEGSAKVIIGSKLHYVKSNESIFVPQGTKHRIENDTDKKLVFIEVQTGSYLSEDDIERFEDDYERLHKNRR